MNSFDWESHIKEWSRKRIELLDDWQKAKLPPEVIESGYLGFPGATEEQLASAEAYLGAILPLSYREFLKVSNGLRLLTWGLEFCSTEDFDWYVNDEEDWINELMETWREPVTDEEYFVYGEGQDDLNFRPEYLRTALDISGSQMGYTFLLNPQIVTADGEWEAWFCSFNSSFGVTRYRSFREMMEIISSDPEFL